MTIGRDARLETECSARATTPLPVPFSPRMSTLASDGPTREITCSTFCIAGDSATILGKPSLRSSEFSASSRWPLRSAWLSSICVRMIESSRALSHGFWMKSRAPAAHGLDGDLDAAPGRHHDDRQRRVEALRCATAG